MAARVSQSVIQLLITTNPNARVFQSVIQLVLIPVAAPVVAAIVNTSAPIVFELPCMDYLDNTGANRDNFPMKGKT